MNDTHGAAAGVFRTDRLPGLSRLPKELGREARPCVACIKTTTHILYRVPKKVVFVYVKDHPENVHATCIECARSEILTGEERERALSGDGEREGGTG